MECRKYKSLKMFAPTISSYTYHLYPQKFIHENFHLKQIFEILYPQK